MDDKPITLASEEDKHVQKVIEANGIKYRITPKYMEWKRCYFDKKNKDTYLNATQSAITAYNLDAETQYGVAENIGYENVRKSENLAGEYFKSQGKTEKDIFEIYWAMMLARKDVNQLYALAKSMGAPLPTYEPVSNPAFVLNQVNNQTNIGEMSVKFSREDETTVPTPIIEGKEASDAQHQTNTSAISDSERSPSV